MFQPDVWEFVRAVGFDHRVGPGRDMLQPLHLPVLRHLPQPLHAGVPIAKIGASCFATQSYCGVRHGPHS